MTEAVETEDEKIRPETHAPALHGSSCARVAHAHGARDLVAHPARGGDRDPAPVLALSAGADAEAP